MTGIFFDLIEIYHNRIVLVFIINGSTLLLISIHFT
jgi:hypothetical protein